jgi:hypothetical protein
MNRTNLKDAPPAGAAPLLSAGRFGYTVPVSFVAKDWNVSARRIRTLLTESRLKGGRTENGYWLVFWPYELTLGTRGPALMQRKKTERRAV